MRTGERESEDCFKRVRTGLPTSSFALAAALMRWSNGSSSKLERVLV